MTEKIEEVHEKLNELALKTIAAAYTFVAKMRILDLQIRTLKSQPRPKPRPGIPSITPIGPSAILSVGFDGDDFVNNEPITLKIFYPDKGTLIDQRKMTGPLNNPAILKRYIAKKVQDAIRTTDIKASK